MKTTKNYKAIDVLLEAGSSIGYHEALIEIPNEFNVISGVALFLEEMPEAFNDFKINVRDAGKDHFNMTSRKLFTSGDSVAPKDKFLPAEIPTGKLIDLKLGIEIPQAVPAETQLKFQVVFEVMNTNV